MKLTLVLILALLLGGCEHLYGAVDAGAHVAPLGSR